MITTTATKDMIVDGRYYNKGEEVPDLGSLVGKGALGDRTYTGLWGDRDKLPLYTDMQIADANLIEKGVGLHYCLLINDGGEYKWFDASTGQEV